MTLPGSVARRLIDERGEGPGHVFRGNQHVSGQSGNGVPMGGSHHAGGHAGATMADAVEMMGSASDPPVDLTADSLTSPTELQTQDLEQFIEAHADLWGRDGSHLVATIDPKTGKVVATVAKLTAPGASSATSTSRAIPEPVHPVEYAALGRRALGGGLFPSHWGDVPIVPEERHSWIAQHCVIDSRGSVSRLIELRTKYLQLSIRARRFGPGE